MITNLISFSIRIYARNLQSFSKSYLFCMNVVLLCIIFFTSSIIFFFFWFEKLIFSTWSYTRRTLANHTRPRLNVLLKVLENSLLVFSSYSGENVFGSMRMCTGNVYWGTHTLIFRGILLRSMNVFGFVYKRFVCI